MTGFYILRAQAPETDGPPGAKVLGDALQSIGYRVVYVTDRHTAPLMRGLAGSGARVVDFPITDDESSDRFAQDLLSEVDASVLVSIERCGRTQDGRYLNMRGKDFSDYNAKIDFLFDHHTCTLGIGDGGNEIGMGNLASVVPTVSSLVREPCVTKTSKLVISSVSNWGAYGLIAALSHRKGRNLLPSVESEQGLVRQAVDLGAVDGMSFKREHKVDGFTLEEYSRALMELHELLAREGVPS